MALRSSALRWFLSCALATALLSACCARSAAAAPSAADVRDFSPAAGRVIDLNDANFESQLEGREVLVNFFAPWCGQCTLFKPIYTDLAARLSQEPSGIRNIAVAKLDCTLNPQTATTQRVAAFPSIKLYRDNQFVAEYSQARTVEAIIQWLREHSKQAHVAVAPKHTPTSTQQQSQPKQQPQQQQQQQQQPAKSPWQLTGIAELLPDFRVDLTDPAAVKQLLRDVLDIPLALFQSHPYMVIGVTYALGVFQGLFFGILFALREKR